MGRRARCWYSPPQNDVHRRRKSWRFPGATGLHHVRPGSGSLSVFAIFSPLMRWSAIAIARFAHTRAAAKPRRLVAAIQHFLPFAGYTPHRVFDLGSALEPAHARSPTFLSRYNCCGIAWYGLCRRKSPRQVISCGEPRRGPKIPGFSYGFLCLALKIFDNPHRAQGLPQQEGTVICNISSLFGRKRSITAPHFSTFRVFC